MKLVDPMGEMLTADWEAYATQLANANNDNVASLIGRWMNSEWKLDVHAAAHVIFARDTRYD